MAPMKALIVGGELQPVKQYHRGGGKKDEEGTTHVCMDRGSPATLWTLLRPVGISCLRQAAEQNVKQPVHFLLVCFILLTFVFQLIVFWSKFRFYVPVQIFVFAVC